MSRTLALMLYPRFTALDIVGPYEVLSRLPGCRSVWVAETTDPVTSDLGLTIVPDATFETIGPVGVLVVPGGPGQTAQMENESLIGFIRTCAQTSRVVSVCTGSLLLARAGLLEGKRAATHWLAREVLASLGAIPVEDRVVQDGGIMTAAGVSAGIDLALTLAAELTNVQVAEAIQLGIEYDPQPPFDSGSPQKAAKPLVEAMRANARAFMQ